MKVKFLKNSEAPMKSTWRCGDGCCSNAEWKPEFFPKDEESEAVAEQSNWVNDGTVDVSGLKFGEDYTITEFP